MRRNACLLAAAMALILADARAEPPRLLPAGDVRYACGGIGSDERRALEPLREAAPLEVVFASAKRGAYLSDVRLTVERLGSPAPAAEILANGPICLVDAPPGRYRLEARLGEAVRSREVRIAANRPHVRVVMAFPDEPWDGIRASEEEKQQARSLP